MASQDEIFSLICKPLKSASCRRESAANYFVTLKMFKALLETDQITKKEWDELILVSVDQRNK